MGKRAFSEHRSERNKRKERETQLRLVQLCRGADAVEKRERERKGRDRQKREQRRAAGQRRSEVDNTNREICVMKENQGAKTIKKEWRQNEHTTI